MKALTGKALIAFAKEHRPSKGPSCTVCISEHATAINEYAIEQVRIRKRPSPSTVQAFLRECGIDLSQSVIARHLREEHYKRKKVTA